MLGYVLIIELLSTKGRRNQPKKPNSETPVNKPTMNRRDTAILYPKDDFMTRKITCLVVFLGALTAPALAQQQPSAPAKPTKAEVQKVVQIISDDQAKLATYCKLAAIDEQMAKASEANDNGKLEQLGKEAEALQTTMGPEYLKLVAGLDEVDPQSKEGEELLSAFDPIDKLCEKK